MLQLTEKPAAEARTRQTGQNERHFSDRNQRKIVRPKRLAKRGRKRPVSNSEATSTTRGGCEGSGRAVSAYTPLAIQTIRPVFPAAINSTASVPKVFAMILSKGSGSPLRRS